jgi:ribosomal protein S4
MRLLNSDKHTRLSKLFNAWDVERAEFIRQKRLRYIYRIDLDQPSRNRKRQKWRFVTRRLSRLFYLTLAYSQFRRLAYSASRKEGSWGGNFIMLVENRVIGMLYRMQILINIFELRQFVLMGKVLVNNKRLTYYNAAVGYGDIIRFDYRLSVFLRYDIQQRFKRKGLYFNTPRYMFVSYKLMFGFVHKEPRRQDLAFPLKVIDVYRSADFY